MEQLFTLLVENIVKYWLSTVSFAFILIIYVVWGGKRDKAILERLTAIECKVGKTVLTKEQTIAVFRAVLNIHIRRKVLFVKQKLIANHIDTRREQIELAMSSEFKKITQEEAQFLSTFNTPAWDVGAILNEILETSQWNPFMEEIFKIIFTKASIEQKLEDLSSYMGNIVGDLVLKIEDKF